MFIHAEEFDHRTASRQRYLEIRIMLSNAGEDAEAGVYNLLLDGSRPVVAVVMPEAPQVELSGHRGRDVTDMLPAALWRGLIERHQAGQLGGPFERHHEPGEPV